MKTIAIDIGGTKFSVAGFEDDRMVLRNSQATDRSGGPEWLCAQIAQIMETWESRSAFVPDRAGIGFGGPVNYRDQSIFFSTHVAGWHSFPLLNRIQEIVGVRPVVDND